MGDTVTVMNLTSRTIVLSSPVGLKEEVLGVGDNVIPLAVWEHSVACCPSLARDPKLFVVRDVPVARVERTTEPEALPPVLTETKSLSELTASEAKRVIEQTTDLDALDAWLSDGRRAVSTAAQKRIDFLMVTP